MPSAVRISLARQSCTALAPSVIEPPPIVTMRSALAARACSAAAITAARGVCGGIASKVPTQRGPSARRIFSISSVSRLSVPLTIRKARLAPQPVHLLDDRLGCRAVRTRPHPWRRIRHGPLCTLCPPRTFWRCCSLGGRLAEETRDVMPKVMPVVPQGWVERRDTPSRMRTGVDGYCAALHPPCGCASDASHDVTFSSSARRLA